MAIRWQKLGFTTARSIRATVVSACQLHADETPLLLRRVTLVWRELAVELPATW